MHCIETFMDMKKKYGVVNDDLEKFQRRHDSFGKKMARSFEHFEFNLVRFSFIVVANPYIHHIQKFLIVHKFVSL